MVAFFCVLLVAFTVVATWYLWVNDFSTETLEVIFPTIGAIILSSYLGVNLIWIKAPEPQHDHSTISVLHDRKSGWISAMPPSPAIDELPEMLFHFRGLQAFDHYKSYSDFEGMPEWRSLQGPAKGHRAPPTLLHLVEFAVLDWLSRHRDLSPGFKDSGPVLLIQSASSGGSFSEELVGVRVQQEEGEWNPFIAARNTPLVLQLPPGSSVSRSAPVPPLSLIKFSITTRHSQLDFKIRETAGGVFEQSLGGVGQQVRHHLRLPPVTPTLWQYGFHVEIVTDQRPHKRFSRQTKLEARWLDKVVEGFRRDWSWELLREYYESRAGE